MKKILTLALALMLVLALAACGEKDPTPSGSGTTNPGTQQSDPGSSQQTPSGGDEKDLKWPDEASAIKWTGAGKIVDIAEGTSGSTLMCVYIDTATLEEVGAYIDTLKSKGFIYHGEGEEPSLAFEDGEFFWAAKANAFRLNLYEEQEDGGTHGTYQLTIEFYTDKIN